jgi:histidyl-tRNA synthetase
MAFLSTQPYKGTRDFYPEEMKIRSWIFSRMSQVCRSFGYQEYDGPMLEPFELYAAKSGEELVNQQLYWMIDRGERKVAVRPEMTPTMARMVAGKVHELPKPVRWFSIPNLWRYERPQRGRLREFWQLNVDVLGGDPLYADAEMLTLAYAMMQKFGGERFVSIRVNNRRLMDELFAKKLGLSPEGTLRVIKAIDARPKIGEEVYAKTLSEAGVSPEGKEAMEAFFSSNLAQVAEMLPCEGANELVRLFKSLEESGLKTGSAVDPEPSDGVRSTVVFDPTIMRGLDYYTGTVFEMFDVSPENRRAMFGGGRYDNLVGLFGKEKLPGVGFGLGDVTFVDFLKTHDLLPKMERSVDVFVSLPQVELREAAEGIARSLRSAGLKTITPLEVGGFGAQLKQAVKHSARYAVLFGETEWAQGKVIVKDLDRNSQVEVPVAEVVNACR